MKAYTVELTIDENGNIEGEAKGIDGPECSDIMKFLDELGKVVADEKTPEYYRKAMQGVKVGGGR